VCSTIFFRLIRWKISVVVPTCIIVFHNNPHSAQRGGKRAAESGAKRRFPPVRLTLGLGLIELSLDLSNQPSNCGRIHLALSPVGARGTSETRCGGPQARIEIVARYQSFKRLSLVDKLKLAEAANLPVSSIVGSGVGAQPRPHEFAIGYVWCFGVALSTKQYKVAGCSRSAQGSRNDVAALKSPLACTSPAQEVRFSPVDRQSALGLSLCPVVNNLADGCFHEA